MVVRDEYHVYVNGLRTTIDDVAHAAATVAVDTIADTAGAALGAGVVVGVAGKW